MRNPLLAALAAIALFPASSALADAAQAHQYKAERAMGAAGSIALFVTTSRSARPHTALQAPAPRREVYVDGILVEMDEARIRGQIDAGAFTVVYPGTRIPWTASEDSHPSYPPDWF